MWRRVFLWRLVPGNWWGELQHERRLVFIFPEEIQFNILRGYSTAARFSDLNNYQNLNRRRLNTVWVAVDIRRPRGIEILFCGVASCRPAAPISTISASITYSAWRRLIASGCESKICGDVRDWAFPNITGTFCTPKWIGFTGWGAMAAWEETGSGKDSADSSGAPFYGIEFNAARSSGIYNGSTLQPKACQTLIIIKAWKAGICTLVPEYTASDLLASNWIRSTPNSMPSVLKWLCTARPVLESAKAPPLVDFVNLK